MTFVVTLCVFLLALGAMAVGIVFSRPPLTGSCGGLGKIEGLDCGVCGNRKKCKRKRDMAS